MKSKFKLILFILIIFFNYNISSQDKKSESNIIPIYVTPFYDSNGPVINVGKFSENILKLNKNRWNKEYKDIKKGLLEYIKYILENEEEIKKQRKENDIEGKY